MDRHVAVGTLSEAGLPEQRESERRSVSGRLWELRDASRESIDRVREEFGLDPIIAHILAGREISPEEIPQILSPTLKLMMPDPYSMRDMEPGAARLSQAIRNRETIGVFGDYDVDGVTATSLLYLYLKSLGCPIEIYLPDRVSDGYGPSIAAFEDLRQRGARLIVTVDCGAAAHEPIDEAGRKGLDVVVLDHHQMQSAPPASAIAVINPNRPDDLSGLQMLSAAGVTFMMMVALNRMLRQSGFFNEVIEPDLRQWLDLVALGSGV